MKKSSVISASLLLIVLLMTFVGYSQTPAEYKAKIQALNKDMAKYLLEGNSEKSLSFYMPDAISMPSYEPMLVGIEAIKKSEMNMKNSGWKALSYEATTQKVIVSGALITEIGTYTISMKMPKMDKPMDDHGKYLTIWEKQKDGLLKIKVETWNTDVDPSQMMKSIAPQDSTKEKN